MLSTGIGLDISDHHVRIAWVNHQGAPKGLYELVLPSGYVVDDSIKKPDALKKQLAKLIAESALSSLEANTVLLLPESRIFLTSFELPGKLSADVERAQALKMGQSELPIPFGDAFVFVKTGYKAKKKGRVRKSVLAVEKGIVNQYSQAFSAASFPFVAIESGGKSLFRLFERFGDSALQLQRSKDVLVVVDIGHRWTNLTAYDKIGAAIFSRSFTLRGLTEKSGGKVHALTAKHIASICSNTQEALSFFEASGLHVPLVLLAGVEGAQEGVFHTCQKSIQKQRILRLGEAVSVPDASLEDVHAYGAAIGAAIRAARPSHYKKDHNFLPV